MQGLTSRLKNKVDFYLRNIITNELGERDINYKKLKSVYGELKIQNGTIQNGSVNNYVRITHKLTIRANSIDNLSNDMYFIHKNLKYNIKYFFHNFKYKDAIDIFAELVIE